MTGPDTHQIWRQIADNPITKILRIAVGSMSPYALFMRDENVVFSALSKRLLMPFVDACPTFINTFETAILVDPVRCFISPQLTPIRNLRAGVFFMAHAPENIPAIRYSIAKGI